MGLDMEIRKVKKLELDPNVVYNRSDIHGMLLEKGFERRPEYRALAPYVTSAKLRVTRLDKKKIMRRYHLSEEIGIVMYFDDGGIGICDDKTGKVILILGKELRENYTIRRVENCSIVGYETVRYWRKEYDLEDWFREHIGDIENCGMYKLSDETIKEFNKAYPEHAISDGEINPDEPLFYWEWY